jgi:glycerol-3-phosphate acyltransferase PlsY
MLELGIKTLLSYLLGSLNGSLLLGRLIGGPDIRTVGSRNAGLTNALRARGKWFALWVMVIDIGKGFAVVTWVAPMILPWLSVDPSISRVWMALACAGAVIIGHCYPVWFGFAGGKGAATGVGVVLALSPDLLVPGLVTWLLVVATTGFVGLATILSAAILPVLLAVTRLPEQPELFVFVLLLALLILYTHRGNVARMLRREENRMSALMVLRRPR